MPTGKVTEFNPPQPGRSGKLGPAKFKLAGDSTEYQLWDQQDGMGPGAEVSFDAQTSEYKGITQYTVKNLVVHSAGSRPPPPVSADSQQLHIARSVALKAAVDLVVAGKAELKSVIGVADRFVNYLQNGKPAPQHPVQPLPSQPDEPPYADDVPFDEDIPF
jgi:hypothetical protein